MDPDPRIRTTDPGIRTTDPDPAFFVSTVKWGNIVFGFNIVTSLSKCLSGHISRYNEFISLVLKGKHIV